MHVDWKVLYSKNYLFATTSVHFLVKNPKFVRKNVECWRKNPAYGRHWIFWPIRIEAPIPFFFCGQKLFFKRGQKKWVGWGVKKFSFFFSFFGFFLRGSNTILGRGIHFFFYWCTRRPTCRALKTRSCSRLQPWMVHAWQIFNWWTGLSHRALKTRSRSRLNFFPFFF